MKQETFISVHVFFFFINVPWFPKEKKDLYSMLCWMNGTYLSSKRGGKDTDFGTATKVTKYENEIVRSTLFKDYGGI